MARTDAAAMLSANLEGVPGRLERAGYGAVSRAFCVVGPSAAPACDALMNGIFDLNDRIRRVHRGAAAADEMSVALMPTVLVAVAYPVIAGANDLNRFVDAGYEALGGNENECLSELMAEAAMVSADVAAAIGCDRGGGLSI